MMNSRTREQILRRVDVLCLTLLTLNILYIIGHEVFEASPTFQSGPENQDPWSGNKRRCPSVVFNPGSWDRPQGNRKNLENPQGNSQEENSQAVVLDGPRESRIYQGKQEGAGEKSDGAGEKSDGAGEKSDGAGEKSDGAGEKSDGAGEKSDGKVVEVCPEFPAETIGEMDCSCNPVTPEYIKMLWPSLETGGRLRPAGCKPRERLAIIIPFKNRTSHLHVLIHNLLPMLHRQLADVTFFVVEQLSPSMFNRATLHNIGFLESQKLGRFDCYIFHDVDLVPLDDRILYRCADNPRHFAVSIKRYGNRKALKMYAEYFGGIVGLSSRQYIDVNGNSNLYFGWGGEDDDLLERVLNKGYERVREEAKIFQYQMLHHEKNDRTRGNVDRRGQAKSRAELRELYRGNSAFRMLLLRTAADRQDYEGLATTKYRVHEIRFDRLYTWISVSLNMTELLLTAPDFSLVSIKSLLEISKTIT